MFLISSYNNNNNNNNKRKLKRKQLCETQKEKEKQQRKSSSPRELLEEETKQIKTKKRWIKCLNVGMWNKGKDSKE